jgi:signal transduction histidine kinase
VAASSSPAVPDAPAATAPSSPATAGPAAARAAVRQRLVPSELVFLRSVAGARALLAVLLTTTLLLEAPEHRRFVALVLLPYLLWCAVLLWRTLRGWFRAASRWWLWLDAAVMLAANLWLVDAYPLLGIGTVLPVVALAVLAGVAPALQLAVACALAMLAARGLPPGLADLAPLPVSVPLLLLVVSPAAALLTRPSRDLRQRLLLTDTLNAASDPRQGLRHHVGVLLGLLGSHFGLRTATISLLGPEPRIFQWSPQAPLHELAEPDLALWHQRLETMPVDRGCIASQRAQGEARCQSFVLDAFSTQRPMEADHAIRRSLLDIGAQALTLPMRSYGQPKGAICLKRDQPPFGAADVQWLHELMREVVPLLERADLLEQLQRETAARERERIGRDLHDSAVQPYLGLKYGLEALARQAGPHNPVAGHIQQLLRLTTDELQNLRDVVGGLRGGDDPTQAAAPLAALERQAQRFEQLFGLKVNIFAGQAPRLRGAVGKAVLHMVNEALTNIRRHTSATAVTVLFEVGASNLLIVLRNDHGRGEMLPADFVPRSLEERATELRGTVNVTHQPDFTEMTITLPLMASIA